MSTVGPSYVEGLRARIGTECIFVPGVRAIIVDEEDRVLLQRRSDFDCWGLPAGGVELNETVEQALCREVAEETGLTVEAMEPMALHSGPSQRFRYPNGDEVQGFAISFIVQFNRTAEGRRGGRDRTSLFPNRCVAGGHRADSCGDPSNFQELPRRVHRLLAVARPKMPLGHS